MKTDSKLTVDDNLVLKSNRTVIPSELQNHVIPLATKNIWELFKTKGLLIAKVYFPKLDELVDKFLAKCTACKVVRKKTPTSNLKHYRNTKNHGYR